MYAQRAASALGQYCEISAGLRRFDDAKSIFLSGDGKIRCVVACNLQEHAAVWAAFIGLPRGMQKARAKAEARRGAQPVADQPAHMLQRLAVRGAVVVVAGTLSGARHSVI